MRNFPPNLAILIIVFVLVGTSGVIYYKQQGKPAEIKNFQESRPKSSPSPILDASVDYSEANSPKSEYVDPSPSPVASSSYIYPESKVLSDSPSKIEMTSTDNSTKITDWYKNKIRELNFNAKSFSQVNTNGVVFNKLSAAKPEEIIEITIKKDQSGSDVSITVDRP